MRAANSSNDGAVPGPERSGGPCDHTTTRETDFELGGDIDEIINILIVDDEPKNLTVLETVLSDPTYRLIRAQSADDALLALLAEQFALLILDIRMPGVTGIELARIIKERKKTAQIPIIFLTAYYNEDQHVLEGYGAGAVDYLHKPVSPEILRSKVAVFADLHRMQRKITASHQNLLAEVAERRLVQAELRALNETLEQRVAERTVALQTSRALLKAATDNASVGLATLDKQLRLTFVNPAYSSIFGLPTCYQGAQLGELVACDTTRQIRPLLESALAGAQGSSELIHQSSDRAKKVAHYSIMCEPERNVGGDINGVVMVVFDITDRKRSEEHIRLLLREVNHRSKNMLSLVAAIARQTAASNPKEFVDRFSQRIQALAASHDLLAKNQWQSIAVSELLNAQLAHFEGLIGQRIALNGPSLMLSVAGAQCIGMVMHELSTNAAKHGALSSEAGVVHIEWQLNSDPEGNKFSISWIESGGPPVKSPDQLGFGSTVTKAMAETSLDGQVWVSYASSGLSWSLVCPASKILDETERGPLVAPR